MKVGPKSSLRPFLHRALKLLRTLGLHVTSQKILNLKLYIYCCKALVVIYFRSLLYAYSQKVWAENNVLFESSRGLSFLNNRS